jgi:hypothetical protein
MDYKDTSLPKNRTFGIFFSSISLLASGYFYYQSVLFWSLILAVLTFALAIISMIRPSWLTIFNKLWFQLGSVLGSIFGPLVLSFIFFILITPVAVAMRLFGRDELRLKRIKRDTYWRVRATKTPGSTSFKDQY